jgi:hypothetical protein
LDAQPAAFTDSVRRNGFVSDMESILPSCMVRVVFGQERGVIPSEARDLGLPSAQVDAGAGKHQGPSLRSG